RAFGIQQQTLGRKMDLLGKQQLITQRRPLAATLTIALQASILRAMTRFNTIKLLEKLFLVKFA
ncbi:hypothetical protein, partial [Lactobacillus delbrueckii]|uniref:hypothetical protein n=1 Tax=Lactobacillus delbrueckii TaxID=1584 RepID=UPI001F43F230